MRWLLPIWIACWVVFSVPWTSATSTPQWHRIAPPRVRSASRIRPDHLLNVLFYVPVAPIASAVPLSLPVCVLAGMTLSLAAEASQLFSLRRHPDWNDLIANTAGTCAGAVLLRMHRRRRLHKPERNQAGDCSRSLNQSSNPNSGINERAKKMGPPWR
jgi:VanZ family protein